MNSNDAWKKFKLDQKEFIERLENVFDFEESFKEDFFGLGYYDYEHGSKTWIEKISKAISDEFFLNLGKNFKKGIQKFCDNFTSNKKNYDYLYENSLGFKFFIDSTPDRIIELFLDDQKKFGKHRKLMKTLWAIRTVGISLITDALIDLGTSKIGNLKLSDLAKNEQANSIFYAIGYSPYWSGNGVNL